MSLTPQIPSNPTLTDLLVALVRVETKVDGFVSSEEDHEERIRALERWRWSIPSAAVLLALASLGMSAASIVWK